MEKKFKQFSIIMLLLIGILYSCTGNDNDDFRSIANKESSTTYSKDEYDKTQRILTLDADMLANEHNNVLKSLYKVSKTNSYSTKENIYVTLMNTELGIDSKMKEEIFNFIDENNAIEKNIESVVNQLNTTEAKDLYVNINNQLDSGTDYESIISILDENTNKINAINDKFDKQVLKIFSSTCKASAHYWYVDANYTTNTTTSKTTPKWVKKDGNGIAQASVGWAVGAAFLGGGPASYFIACGVGGAIASIWPD